MVVLVTAGVIGGVVWFSGGRTTIGLSFDLHDATSTAGLANGAACTGKGKYVDINPTTIVQVRGASFNVLDTSTLGPGVVWQQTHCVFSVSLSVSSSSSYP
jgi:hypothetical protein